MKTVVVTGASGGIGFGLTQSLLAAGFNVVAQYKSNRNNLVSLFESFGFDSEKHVILADLTIEDDCLELSRKVLTDHGPAWAIINLAGTSTNSMSWNLGVDQFKKVIDDSLLSTFLSCKAFIPQMREQKAGRIINTSSVVAHSGVAGAAHYCAAKAGVEGLSKSLSLELAPKNVTVNVISLGYFDVGMITHVSADQQELIKNKTPTKRFGTINDVKSIVLYLLNDDSSFMTGQVIHVNGGLL